MVISISEGDVRETEREYGWEEKRIFGSWLM